MLEFQALGRQEDQEFRVSLSSIEKFKASLGLCDRLYEEQERT